MEWQVKGLIICNKNKYLLA